MPPDKSGFDIVVSGLVRDGATTWIADIEIPALHISFDMVYLHGATEEDAYNFAARTIGEWYAGTRKVPPGIHNN